MQKILSVPVTTTGKKFESMLHTAAVPIAPQAHTNKLSKYEYAYLTETYDINTRGHSRIAACSSSGGACRPRRRRGSAAQGCGKLRLAKKNVPSANSKRVA